MILQTHRHGTAVRPDRYLVRFAAALLSSHALVLIATSTVLTLATAPALHAQVSTGVVEGRVFNAASGNALVNARVTIEGISREAITDESGSYRFAVVPAGTANIRVLYLGMESQAATVQVPAGGSVAREFELQLDRGGGSAGTPDETVKLDAFRVVVDREMSAQAIAMNEQRRSNFERRRPSRVFPFVSYPFFLGNS